MPKVIYNGNGNTGGSVPVDNASYAVNGSFTVAGLGSLTQGSNPFFFWNTKADGTGTIFNPGPSTFPNQSTNLTLFAIWGVTTGLTNGGVTTHFNFFYDPSLGGAGGIEPGRINQLLAAGAGGKPVIENDFDWLQAQFAGVDMTKSKLPDPGSRDRRRRIGLQCILGLAACDERGKPPRRFCARCSSPKCPKCSCWRRTKAGATPTVPATRRAAAKRSRCS